ncbi:hypothetical protein [Gemella morbillorum]
MKKKTKKNPTNSSIDEKMKQYTIEELLELGSKTNKIEIAPDIFTKNKLDNDNNKGD